MNIKKSIFRILSAFLIFAVFMAAAVPAGAQDKELVENLCDILLGEQTMSMSMNGCSSQQANKTTIQSADKNNEVPCHTIIVCSCCISESPIGSKAAPISQTVSSKIVALQVDIISQSKTSSPPVSSVEQQFIEAVTSSPPLFLKNSSFLN